MHIVNTSWTTLKYIFQSKRLVLQFDEDSSAYTIYCFDGLIQYKAIIFKGSVPDSNFNQTTNDSEKTDFENNYKNLSTTNRPAFSVVDGYSIASNPILIAGVNNNQSKILALDGYGAIKTSIYDIDGYSLPINSDGETPSNDKGLMIDGYDSTNAKTRRLAVDSLGRVIIAPAGSVSSIAGFSYGDVTTAAITQFTVRRTVYVEQTTNAQRSMYSSNAADSSTGTGARTVKITYLNASGDGPFIEIITMNGATPVNTVNTNICFIEKIEVLTVGSNNSNAGNIFLRTTTGGGGSTIWSINIGNNQTFGAHHYVPNGKISYITSFSGNHSGTTVGSGGVFILKSQSLPVGSNAQIQISDFVRLYGQANTVVRDFGTPIAVVGPSRILAYITPESSTTLVYRAAFDFYDQ